MLVLAFLAAWRRYAMCLEWGGEDKALAERLLFWAVIGGVVGAKISFLLSFPSEFAKDPIAAVFSGAGFVFYGGLIGGFLAVTFLLHRLKKNIIRHADLIGPALAIGYAIGRIGCQFSGDGDYGIESTLPWAHQYFLGVVPTEPGVRVHPTPVYETLAAFGIVWILLKVRTLNWFVLPGQAAGLYLILASTERFAVEFLRIEPQLWSGLTQAQLIAAVGVCIGLVLVSGTFFREQVSSKK